MKAWRFIAMLLALLPAGCGGGTASDESDAAPKKRAPRPEDPEAAATLQRYKVEMEFDAAQRVIALDFSRTNATNPWLAHLEGLPNVERLNLRGTEVSDTGLAHLVGLGRLVELHLPQATTTAGLAAVQGLTALEELHLPGAGVDDDGMAYLADLKALRALDLSDTRIGDHGLAQLAGLERLQTLRIGGTRVTDGGLAVVDGMPQLTRVNLFLLGGVTDASIDRLARLRGLKEIDLGFTGISPGGVKRLRQELPQAEIRY